MKKNDVTKLFLSNHRYYTSRYVFYKNKEFCVYNEEGGHVDFRNYPNIVSFITEGISFCYSYDKGANVW